MKNPDHKSPHKFVNSKPNKEQKRVTKEVVKLLNTKKGSPESERIKKFDYLFFDNAPHKNGCDHIRVRSWEITEIRNASSSRMRNDQIDSIIKKVYGSAIDFLLDKIKAYGDSTIPDNIELLIDLIDNLLPQIDKRFKASPTELTEDIPTNEESEIIKNVTKIISEIKEMPQNSRSIKSLLQEKLTTLWDNHQKSSKMFGYERKEFARKYLWENGIKDLERYGDFNSFYTNIFLK